MLNGILVVDKPEGLSSHGVVSRLRRILGERRIGHGGTLDPLATGVLPIFIGRATRASDLLLSSDKAYLARFRLGMVTDTQDITGSVLSECDPSDASEALPSVLPRFTGTIRQIPPMYSALKVGGRKLYEIARSGEEIEREARSIHISTLRLLDGTETNREQSTFFAAAQTAGDYAISVDCSKGTYIRTLVHDIGTALGCGATLSALRRIRTGAFSIENALTLEQIAEAAEQGDAASLLTPVDALFGAYAAVHVDADGERLCRCGALLPAARGREGEMLRVYGPDGSFLMLGQRISQNGQCLIKTVKNYFNVG